MALAVIGSNPGGTAGDVKADHFPAPPAGASRDALASRPVPRVFGIAAIWLVGYFAIVALGFVCLLWQAPELSPDHLLFMSISAASNVGALPRLDLDGAFTLITLSLVMVLGRIAPLLVLWWMAETTTDAEIAVG